MCYGALRAQLDRLDLMAIHCILAGYLAYVLLLGPDISRQESEADDVQLSLTLIKFKCKS